MRIVAGAGLGLGAKLDERAAGKEDGKHKGETPDISVTFDFSRSFLGGLHYLRPLLSRCQRISRDSISRNARLST